MHTTLIMNMIMFMHMVAITPMTMIIHMAGHMHTRLFIKHCFYAYAYKLISMTVIMHMMKIVQMMKTFVLAAGYGVDADDDGDDENICCSSGCW